MAEECANSGGCPEKRAVAGVGCRLPSADTNARMQCFFIGGAWAPLVSGRQLLKALQPAKAFGEFPEAVSIQRQQSGLRTGLRQLLHPPYCGSGKSTGAVQCTKIWQGGANSKGGVAGQLDT